MTILSIHATRPVEFAIVIDRVPAGMLIVAATVRQQLTPQANATQALDAPETDTAAPALACGISERSGP